MTEPIIQAHDISKRYKLGQIQGYKTIRDSFSKLFPARNHRTHQSDSFSKQINPENTDAEYIWALKNVSFEIYPGEAVGIIGRNGAGKSTLLKILTRITEPTEGRAVLRGRVSSLLEVGTGFHPELTGRENVYLNGTILGMRKKEIENKFDEIVAFAEVERFIDTPVKRYSTGMYVRLAFAVAAYLEPEILLVDEVLAVGDYDFQKKCIGKMSTVAKEGRTILFVSHNMAAINSLCSKAMMFENGKLTTFERACDVVQKYLTRNAHFRAERTWPEENAPSDGETLKVLKISLRNKQGNLTETFSNNDDIVIEFTLRLLSTPRSLRIGYDIINSEGMVIFRSFHDGTNGFDNSLFTTGVHLFRSSIPAGVLNKGSYFLSIRCGIHAVKWCVSEDNVLSFDMVMTESASGFYLDEPGAILPPSTWTMVN